MKLSAVVLLVVLALFTCSASAWYQHYTHPFLSAARRLPLHSRLWGFSDPFDELFHDLEPLFNTVNQAAQQQEQLLHRLLQEHGADADALLRGPSASESSGQQGVAGDTQKPLSELSEAVPSEQAAADDQPSSAAAAQPQKTQVQTTRRSSDSENDLLNWFPADLFHGPTLDITSSDKLYEISVDVPGVKKEDIKLEIQSDRKGRQTLTVSGERKSESRAGDAKSSRSGKFVRSLYLPENVNVDGVEAEHRDGVLHITVPKLVLEPPKKKEITIRSVLKEEL